MKTKQEFITEFVLRTMTNPDVAAINTESERDMLEWAIGLANRAWDAIQAANQPLEGDLVALAEKTIKDAKEVLSRILPSVANSPEKTKYMENSPPTVDIIALAQKAAQVSRGAAKWLTIDADGEVNAFDMKPSVDQHSNDMWVAFDPYSESGWLIGNVHPPSDFTKKCYSISDILGTE